MPPIYHSSRRGERILFTRPPGRSVLCTRASVYPSRRNEGMCALGLFFEHTVINIFGQSDNEQISLAHVQSWILLGHFEAQHLWFSRASMSIARAIRLSQILGLHRLDSKNVAGLTLPPPADLAEDQERRRTFWVMFCTDRITSSTGGWPTMIDARSVSSKVPMCGRGLCLHDAKRFRHGSQQSKIRHHRPVWRRL